jgi:putative endonuclease
MGFYCYILKCADGTYYTGWTTDPERRERQHNSGRGARYTKARRPVKLVYIEPQPNRSMAQKREIKIKKLSRVRKEALIRKQMEVGDQSVPTPHSPSTNPNS